jgi:hypothetical protein
VDLKRCLKVITTAPNVNDVTQPLALVNAIPSVADCPPSALPSGDTACCAAWRDACVLDAYGERVIVRLGLRPEELSARGVLP